MTTRSGLRVLRWSVLLLSLAGSAWIGYLGYRWHAQRPLALLRTLPLRDTQGAAQPWVEAPGQVLVVNFWASWCAPCQDEMPLLGAAARDYAGRVQFVGVAWESPVSLAAYVRQNARYSYPLVGVAEQFDLGAVLVELGNSSRALPFSVVFGQDGRVRAIQLGAWRKEALYGVLDGLTEAHR